MELIEKLMVIQSKLKVPKGQYNSFGKYNYRNCEDILEAVKPLLAEQKAVLLLSDEVVLMGNRYYIKATAKFWDVETKESIENVAFAREEETKKGMDGSQVTGASSSYARKYALNGLFGIDDTKDSDTTNQGEEKYCCEVCGTVFKGYTLPKNGTFVPPETEFVQRKRKFGQALCDGCLKKRKETSHE